MTDNNQQHPITIRNNNTQQHRTPHTAAQDHTGPHSARHACQCSVGSHDAACCSGPCGAGGVSPCGGPHVPPGGRTAGGGEKVISVQDWKNPQAREAARAFWASLLNIPTQFSTDLHATLLSVAWTGLEAGFTPRKAAPRKPWISDDSWQMVQTRLGAGRQHLAATRFWRRSFTCLLFTSLRLLVEQSDDLVRTRALRVLVTSETGTSENHPSCVNRDSSELTSHCRSAICQFGRSDAGACDWVLTHAHRDSKTSENQAPRVRAQESRPWRTFRYVSRLPAVLTLGRDVVGFGTRGVHTHSVRWCGGV